MEASHLYFVQILLWHSLFLYCCWNVSEWKLSIWRYYSHLAHILYYLQTKRILALHYLKIDIGSTVLILDLSMPSLHLVQTFHEFVLAHTLFQKALVQAYLGCNRVASPYHYPLKSPWKNEVSPRALKLFVVDISLGFFPKCSTLCQLLLFTSFFS